jgi:hypothetical protein
MLAPVGAHADLLPLAAQAHVAQAFAAVEQAKAILEERVPEQVLRHTAPALRGSKDMKGDHYARKCIDHGHDGGPAGGDD